MGAMNFLQFISQLKKSPNPAAFAQQLINQNFSTDPMMNNLLLMAKSGDTASLEKFAQQYFASKGRDFNQEFKSFMDMLGK